MRSHNHSLVKDYCRSIIPNLMEKHELGEVNSVRMDTEGWVNPCFFVNNDYVIRFNARDPKLPKYYREKVVFDLLKNSKIPVPQDVILDADKDICRYDILITGMLNGSNIEFHWNELLPEKKDLLAASAGSLLRELHNIKFQYFGEIAGLHPLPQTKNWYDFLEAKLNFLLSEARELEIFNKTQEQGFMSVLSSMKTEVNSVKEASLVHVDFHFGNLLFNENRITGVIDFEWAIAGDPLYDLMFWRSGDETFPGSQEGFFKGYGKHDFSAVETKLISLYQMLKNIELTIVATLHFPKEEAKDYLDVTLNQFSLL